MCKANYQVRALLACLFCMSCLLFICWHLTLTNWICTIYMPLNKLGKLSRTFQNIFLFCYFIIMTEILQSTKKLKLQPNSDMDFCRLYVTEHNPKRKEMAREKECFKFSQFIHLDTHEMWVEWYLEVLVPTGATASLKSHSYLYNLAINNEIFV